MDTAAIIIVGLLIAGAIVAAVYIYSKSKAQTDTFNGLLSAAAEYFA